jgi:hypothetical protein
MIFKGMEAQPENSGEARPKNLFYIAAFLKAPRWFREHLRAGFMIEPTPATGYSCPP